MLAPADLDATRAVVDFPLDQGDPCPTTYVLTGSSPFLSRGAVGRPCPRHRTRSSRRLRSPRRARSVVSGDPDVWSARRGRDRHHGDRTSQVEREVIGHLCSLPSARAGGLSIRSAQESVYHKFIICEFIVCVQHRLEIHRRASDPPALDAFACPWAPLPRCLTSAQWATHSPPGRRPGQRSAGRGLRRVHRPSASPLTPYCVRRSVSERARRARRQLRVSLGGVVKRDPAVRRHDVGWRGRASAPIRSEDPSGRASPRSAADSTLSGRDRIRVPPPAGRRAVGRRTPVAPLVGFEPNTDCLGRPFFVMQYVPGRVPGAVHPFTPAGSRKEEATPDQHKHLVGNRSASEALRSA